MAEQVDRNAAVCEAYRTGKSLRKVAAEFGISHERVAQILRAKGEPTRSSSARKEHGLVKGLGQIKGLSVKA